MLRTQGIFLALVAVLGITAGNVNAQCQTCNVGTHYTGQFGYPQGMAAGCGSGCNSPFQNFREHMDQVRAESAKIEARNAAWPRPFDCADRQAYHALWAANYNAGWVNQCTLSDTHFDLETGALNRLGESVIQGLMRNTPEHRRQVYLYNGQSSIDLETKRQSVLSVVDRWYGPGSIQIAETSNWPVLGNGLRGETTNSLYADGTPPPVIAIPTGTGSTSDTTAGN